MDFKNLFLRYWIICNLCVNFSRTFFPLLPAGVVRSSNSLQSASAVLGKIPDSMNLEFLKMLVENILVSGSRSATGTFALELLPDISSAVVTFQSKKGKGP